MTVGATLLASFLIALTRPATWVLGLLGFLVRGGFALVVAPIVVLPTPVGLANVLAPLLEDVAFGRRTAQVVELAAVAVVAVLVWLLGGGIVAAAAEVELVRSVAADDELSAGTRPTSAAAPWPAPDRGRAWRVLAVRLVADLPLAVALAWGSIRIVSVTYQELTVPSDVGSPLAVRILAGAPDAIVGVILSWLVGETIGAVAARRVILLGEGVPSSLRGALGRFLRRPGRTLAIGTLTTAVVSILLGLTAVALAAAWDGVRASLAVDGGWLAPVLLVVTLVALFGVGLVLLGVVAAWRSAVWTVELDGTFGARHGARTGD